MAVGGAEVVVGLVAMIVMGLIPLLAIGAVVFIIISCVSRSGGGVQRQQAQERFTRLDQAWKTMDRMEEKIENLETVLLERQRPSHDS